MTFPVTLTPDLSVHLPLMLQSHQYVSGATGLAALGVDLEVVANQYWLPGVLFGKVKFTETVKHRNLCIMLEGHDLGPMLLHAPLIPIPDNILSFVLHTLKSSRKVMFSAGEVQANGTPIGCNAFSPFTPMLTCGQPVPLPLAFSPTNITNTVLVGLDDWDLLAGWAAILVEMVRSWVRWRTSAASPAPETVGELLRSEVMGGRNDIANSQIDSIFSGANAQGLVRAIARASGDYHGPASFSVKHNQGMLNERSIQYTTNDDGDQVQVGEEWLGGLASGQMTGRRNRDGDLSLVGQASGPAGLSTGNQNIVSEGDQGVTWF